MTNATGAPSVDHLQTYSGTLGPQSEGARPCFPESGQRPRQWGNEDGASCHAHNLSVSNNRPLPRGSTDRGIPRARATASACSRTGRADQKSSAIRVIAFAADPDGELAAFYVEMPPKASASIRGYQ